jgi:hypothetical protein
MNGKTPQQRTKEFFQGNGYTVDDSERILHGGKRKDLFGFADLVAFRPGQIGAVFIQATTVENMNARVSKIRSEPCAKICIECGNRVVVVGWREVRFPGRRPQWLESIRWFELDDFPQKP